MGDPSGGSAPWCPDCGTKLAPGQRLCPTCGLDYLAPVAREVERFNGSIHAARAQVAQWERSLRGLVDQRSALLAAAPRDVRPTVAPPVGVQAVVAPLPTIEDQAAPFPLASQEPSRVANVVAAPSPMRAPRSVSAAGLLGVASAALFVLAGLVYVAASWSSSMPATRMIILLAFAGLFAWMARMATRRSFADVGGALGVVAAAFVGVAVYAAEYGPNGLPLFTVTWSTLGVAAAGLVVARWHIKAVGRVAAGAVVFALLATTIEVAVLADDARRAVSLASLVLTVGPALLVAVRKAWPSEAQRAITLGGAYGLGLVGALLALLGPLADDIDLPLALAATACVVAAWSAAARSWPLWTVGVLTGFSTLAAAAWAIHLSLELGQVALASAAVGVLVLVALRVAPALWVRSGLIGLTASLLASVIAVVTVVTAVLFPVVLGLDTASPANVAQVGSPVWCGAALLVVALSAVVARMGNGTFALPRAWEGAASAAWALGTVIILLDVASRWGGGLQAVGLAFVGAGVIHAATSRLWDGPAARAARSAAVALMVLGAFHSLIVLTIADGTEVSAPLLMTAAGAGLVLVSLAARWIPSATAGAVAIAVCGASALTWHLTQELAHTSTAAATTGAVCLVVAHTVPARHAGFARSASVLSAAAALPVGWAAASAIERLASTGTLTWQPAWLIALTALTVCALATRSLRARAVPLTAVATVLGTLLVASPYGWTTLAVLVIPVTHAGMRWRGWRGLGPAVGIFLGFASLALGAQEWPGVPVATAALALAALWMITRLSEPSPDRDGALMLAPAASGVAAAFTLNRLGLSVSQAMVVAAGIALVMPLVAVRVGRDPRARMAIVMLTVVSAVVPVIIGDHALACVVFLLASAAWLAMATLGTSWARWVALGLLTPFAVTLGLVVGWTAVEAYTAVPTVSLLYVGLWWLRRDPALRTYRALSPGLALAIVPSIAAMVSDPEVLERPALLLVGAVLLAAVGVARRWFAPILATAVIGVAVALAQVVAEEALVPRWMSAAFIGGILLSLAFVAERIKEMR